MNIDVRMTLAQVDTTLVNLDNYLRLFKAANKMKYGPAKAAILHFLKHSFENACDTMRDGGCTPIQWDEIFRNTLLFYWDARPERNEFDRTINRRAWKAVQMFFVTRDWNPERATY